MSSGDKKLEYSPEWKGPLKNRSCTDWPCLIIFVIFMVVWIAIGTFAMMQGDIRRLLAPEDSYGRKCGLDEEVINEPYLFFFDPRECLNLQRKCNTPQVCRNECPTSNWADIFIDLTSLNYTRSNMICETGINVWDKDLEQLRALIETKKCAKWYFSSTSVFKRCFPTGIPKNLTEIVPMTENELKQIQRFIEALAYGEKILDTMIATRGTILGFIAGGAGVCLIYIFLLRWLAFPFVFLSVIVLCSFLSYLAFYFYDRYTTEDENLWLSLTILFGIIAGLILLLVICLLKRIRLACQLIKEASKAVSSILSSLLFPIFPWLFHLAVIIYAIVIGLYLYTIKVEESWRIKLFVALHIIGFIWLYCFITALGEMILSSTFATWYWTFRKIDVPFFTVATGAWRTIRYHLGTIAFGSFLITICRLIRYILEAIRHSVQSEQGFLHTVCTRYCITCAQVLVKLLEKFLKFMNRNAYIVCAVYGKGLCASASDALSLLLRNALRAIVLNNIVSWLLFLGKLAIAIAMGSITWWYYTDTIYKTELWWVPVIFVSIGAYLVANVFFGVYEVAVDTIFLCFLEDCERHDGTISKPYYMSRQLRKLLHKDL